MARTEMGNAKERRRKREPNFAIGNGNRNCASNLKQITGSSTGELLLTVDNGQESLPFIKSACSPL